jgi:hypothetical protein
VTAWAVFPPYIYWHKDQVFLINSMKTLMFSSYTYKTIWDTLLKVSGGRKPCRIFQWPETGPIVENIFMQHVE